MKSHAVIVSALLVASGVLLAQRRSGGWRGGGGDYEGSRVIQTEGGDVVDEDIVRTAREVASHSTGTPTWTNDPAFARDVFTFVRVLYSRAPQTPDISWTASRWGWITDFPDSDLNLSFRLQQVTSIKTDPDARVLRLTDPALFDYPWIYMVEPGRLRLRDEDVEPLRKYLDNGGVLWADDFWGQKQWDTFARAMKRVFPQREFEDLDMTNKIFHSIFDIKVPMNQLQTPNVWQGIQSLDPGSGLFGVTWEFRHDDYVPDGTKDMHVRALYDDKRRIMVIATHNCDNGDGWEREGENDGFFHEFSEKRAYPLGINVIFYLMTH